MKKGDKKRRRALDAYSTLQRAASLAAARVDATVHNYGLSASQFGTLEILQEHGPIHQQELADSLGRSKAQITAIIDTLERHALVRRERHADDRRFISVFLTDAGRLLLAEAAPARSDAILSLMRELDSEQRSRLVKLCKRLLRALEDERADQLSERADDQANLQPDNDTDREPDDGPDDAPDELDDEPNDESGDQRDSPKASPTSPDSLSL